MTNKPLLLRTCHALFEELVDTIQAIRALLGNELPEETSTDFKTALLDLENAKYQIATGIRKWESEL
jgi:hypothetical protein